VINRELRNASDEPETIAPWAVTQLRAGAMVILPAAAEETGSQADRYAAGGSPLKLGVAPSEGRVAYRLDSSLFEKRVDVDPTATYADRGAVVQVYPGADFCELETLGPLRTVERGASLTHQEHWALSTDRSVAHPNRTDARPT
jgi:hypothetical protein